MKYQIISDMKLLCYSATYFLFSRGARLFYKKVNENEYSYIGKLPSDIKLGFLSNLQLFNRILRLEPRCGIFIDDNTALISYHGGIYKIDCDNKILEQEHSYRSGMNNPLCFSKINNIDGFDNGIYYGEYFGNTSNAPVRIMKRLHNGEWSCAYEFEAGTVNHIHNIIPHEQKKSIFILTGDSDSQSAIWECKDDFRDVKPVLIGKQIYRAAVAFPVENGLIYVTDTPLEDNYVYNLDFDTGILKKVRPINGPAIYGKMINDKEFIFSTSVEPDSRLKGLRYKLTYRRGKGVKDRYSHIYDIKISENMEVDCREIMCAQKDIYPMLLFQFGTFLFPTGEDQIEGNIYVTGQSLKKLDKKTILINTN